MKHLRYFMLILAAVVCSNIFAQKSQQELKQLMQQRNEYYFTFELNGHDDLKAIAHAISVDRVDGKTVTAYANNKDFAKFEQFGYEITLQTPPSMLEKHVLWDGSNRAAYEWDQYPTYEAYEAMMFQFAADHPDKCEIITLGTLPSGRKIMIAHINNGTTEGKPKFLYTSTIHGDETTGWMLMLRLIDYLLENPNLPEVQAVMNNIDLYIGPNTNPDGTYHAGNNYVGDPGSTRFNADGIDLNRNYPDPHGSAHPDDSPYATETEWFMQFAETIPFTMGANFHGGAEVMNYPWDNTHNLHADDAWWQLVCHEYADLCQAVSPNYMNQYNDGITNGAQWYMIGGGRQDYMNGYTQCREVTIECSNTKLPNASQMPTFWNRNKDALFAYMNQCLYGIHGTVIDAATSQPLEATVTIMEHDDQYSAVGSHLPVGDFHRPIKGGTYTVTVTASGYLPHQETVTVADYETVNLDIRLEAGEGILPDFTANALAVAPGSSVSFTDQTWGLHLTQWEWTFEGGTPATSNAQNPTVTYNTGGKYDVTLTVTNADGLTETITKPDFINVCDLYNMQTATVETCNAMFYDNGGPNGNYSNRKDYTMTFKPGTPGRYIQVVFESFALEADYDFLYAYDGTTTNAPLIGEYSGHDNPGKLTATNAQGAITFRFTSDTGVNEEGWVATVSCSDSDTLSVKEEHCNALLYPNPSDGHFTIETHECGMTYTLYNSLGQVLISGMADNGKTCIDASHLAKGIYFLRINGLAGSRMEKLVIE